MRLQKLICGQGQKTLAQTLQPTYMSQDQKRGQNRISKQGLTRLANNITLALIPALLKL